MLIYCKPICLCVCYIIFWVPDPVSDVKITCSLREPELELGQVRKLSHRNIDPVPWGFVNKYNHFELNWWVSPFILNHFLFFSKYLLSTYLPILLSIVDIKMIRHWLLPSRSCRINSRETDVKRIIRTQKVRGHNWGINRMSWEFRRGRD